MLKKVYICAPRTDQPEKDLEQAKRYAGYALKCGTAPVVPHFYAECISGTRKQLRELIQATALSLIWSVTRYGSSAISLPKACPPRSATPSS